MFTNDQALKVVFRAMGKLNSDPTRPTRLPARPQTVLVGQGGTLDSLSLVNLIVSIEEGAQESFGLQMNLLAHIMERSAQSWTAADLAQALCAREAADPC